MKETKNNLKFVELCNTLEGIETYPLDKKILQYLTKLMAWKQSKPKFPLLYFLVFSEEKLKNLVKHTKQLKEFGVD